MKSSDGGIAVFSGGSAANHLVDVFNAVVEIRGCHLSYVIPISDNGGSSSELIRVLGGPGIGDLRSRLVRLIPTDNGNDPELRAIRTFFNHRLAATPQEARMEWLDIVEARHELWNDIDSSKKELIRSFLNLLNMEIVKRARPSSVFAFERASVGNLFLTGARLFSGSLESAIYLVSSICTIPQNISVLPAINTNFSHHICAGLGNGYPPIPGQNAISHPSVPTRLKPLILPGAALRDSTKVENAISLTHLETENADTIEDANLPGSLPTLRKTYINVSKAAEDEEALPSRIKRIWYINPYGQEIRPPANPKIISAIRQAQSIIYSIGSLYTSIVPSLILRGVGEAITWNSAAQKILLLNGSLDRETGPQSPPFTAMDFVRAITRAGFESRGIFEPEPGISDLSVFITHVVYVEGEGVPYVDKDEFNAAGIELVRTYGRPLAEKGWKYDEAALTQVITTLVGKRSRNMDKSRRNTIEL